MDHVVEEVHSADKVDDTPRTLKRRPSSKPIWTHIQIQIGALEPISDLQIHGKNILEKSKQGLPFLATQEASDQMQRHFYLGEVHWLAAEKMFWDMDNHATATLTYLKSPKRRESLDDYTYKGKLKVVEGIKKL